MRAATDHKNATTAWGWWWGCGGFLFSSPYYVFSRGYWIEGGAGGCPRRGAVATTLPYGGRLIAAARLRRSDGGWSPPADHPRRGLSPAPTGSLGRKRRCRLRSFDSLRSLRMTRMKEMLDRRLRLAQITQEPAKRPFLQAPPMLTEQSPFVIILHRPHARMDRGDTEEELDEAAYLSHLHRDPGPGLCVL